MFSNALLYEDRYFVYVLKCCGDVFYTGMTARLVNRMWHHIMGKGAVFTRKHLPVDLIHLEIKETYSEAIRRETEITRMTRKGNFYCNIPNEFIGFYHQVAGMSSKHCKDYCLKNIQLP